jgi:hypothetical protein
MVAMIASFPWLQRIPGFGCGEEAAGLVHLGVCRFGSRLWEQKAKRKVRKEAQIDVVRTRLTGRRQVGGQAMRVRAIIDISG